MESSISRQSNRQTTINTASTTPSNKSKKYRESEKRRKKFWGNWRQKTFFFFCCSSIEETRKFSTYQCAKILLLSRFVTAKKYIFIVILAEWMTYIYQFYLFIRLCVRENLVGNKLLEAINWRSKLEKSFINYSTFVWDESIVSI